MNITLHYKLGIINTPAVVSLQLFHSSFHNTMFDSAGLIIVIIVPDFHINITNTEEYQFGRVKDGNAFIPEQYQLSCNRKHCQA